MRRKRDWRSTIGPIHAQYVWRHHVRQTRAKAYLTSSTPATINQVDVWAKEAASILLNRGGSPATLTSNHATLPFRSPLLLSPQIQVQGSPEGEKTVRTRPVPPTAKTRGLGSTVTVHPPQTTKEGGEERADGDGTSQLLKVYNFPLDELTRFAFVRVRQIESK